VFWLCRPPAEHRSTVLPQLKTSFHTEICAGPMCENLTLKWRYLVVFFKKWRYLVVNSSSAPSSNNNNNLLVPRRSPADAGRGITIGSLDPSSLIISAMPRDAAFKNHLHAREFIYVEDGAEMGEIISPREHESASRRLALAPLDTLSSGRSVSCHNRVCRALFVDHLGDATRCGLQKSLACQRIHLC
jgi:hypothetical protein